MNKHNFFISYCKTDGSDIAEELSNQLIQKGYTVFKDLDSSRANFDFQDEILKVIANSNCFIPIITEGYATSAWAMAELGFALSKAEGRGTPVFPIVTNEVSSSKLQYHIGHMRQFQLDNTVDLPCVINKVVEQLDKFVGFKSKTSVLYEKLSEYKKLNNHNKGAETICELIRLTRENFLSVPKIEFQRVWRLCEDLLNLYVQLSNYVGRYNEESRSVSRRILNELDETYNILNISSRNGKRNLFQRHILFAAVAIRLMYFDRKIRSECEDILSNGEAKNDLSFSSYVEKQKDFVDLFNSEYVKVDEGGFEESKRQFIEETKNFFFDTSNRGSIGSVFEREVYSALTKCGYSVDAELRLNKYIVDMAIKKNGKYVLYIECVSGLANTPRILDSKKELANHIESIGGKLHIISLDDWTENPQAEIEKVKNIVNSVSTHNDEILISIAKFIQDGNKLFDVLQKDGIAGDFLECLRESYERLKNYCVIVGANDVAADCAERIVEIRNEAVKLQEESVENEKAEKGIKSLLGFTLEGSGKYDVFISFKNEDSDLAEKVYEYCNKHMKQPFWSKKSLPRLSKSEYSKAIDEALENSKHFVVVLSDLSYLDSEWISYEMDVFHNEKKEGRKDKSSNFIFVVTDDIYDEIKKKTVLSIAYRRYQIIKMSEYEETLSQYIS